MWKEKAIWPEIPKTKAGYRATLTKRLRNPLYWGYFFLTNDPNKYIGKHELIIPADILEKVQAINEGNPNRPVRPLNEHGVFGGGWLRCAHPGCGLSITYEPKKKKIKSTGREKTYHYYRCTNQRKAHTGRNKTAYISEGKIMQQFEDGLEEFEVTEQFARDIMDQLNENHAKAVAAHRKQGEGFRKVLKDLEVKENSIIDLLAEGSINKKMFDRRIQAIRDERDCYSRQLDDLNVAISDASHIAVKRVLELAISAKSLFKNMNKQERVTYLKRVYSNPVLDKLSVEYQLQKPFEWLAKNRENKEWRRG